MHMTPPEQLKLVPVQVADVQLAVYPEYIERAPDLAAATQIAPLGNSTRNTHIFATPSDLQLVLKRERAPNDHYRMKWSRDGQAPTDFSAKELSLARALHQQPYNFDTLRISAEVPVGAMRKDGKTYSVFLYDKPGTLQTDTPLTAIIDAIRELDIAHYDIVNPFVNAVELEDSREMRMETSLMLNTLQRTADGHGIAEYLLRTTGILHNEDEKEFRREKTVSGTRIFITDFEGTTPYGKDSIVKPEDLLFRFLVCRKGKYFELDLRDLAAQAEDLPAFWTAATEPQPAGTFSFRDKLQLHGKKQKARNENPYAMNRLRAHLDAVKKEAFRITHRYSDGTAAKLVQYVQDERPTLETLTYAR
jgi:hypothetical protein